MKTLLCSLLLSLGLLWARGASAECTYPLTTVNDGLDDRQAVLDALTAAAVTGHDLCFEAGRYSFYRWGVGSGCTDPNVNLREQGVCGRDSFGAIPLRGPAFSGITLRGAGDRTVLEFRGDWAHDGAMIDIVAGADGVTVQGLKIDASTATFRNEQLHLISGGDRGVKGLTIRDVTFYNPPTGIVGQRIGDSIHLLAPRYQLPGGEWVEPWVENTLIDHVHGVHAGRALLYYNYGTRRLTLVNSFCDQATDQCVDGEVSNSVRVPAVADVTIANNILTTGNGQGVCMGLGGTGFQSKITILGNRCTDGGILLAKGSDATVMGNVVDGEIGLIKEFSGAVIVGNTVTSWLPRPAISATCRESGCPSRVMIGSNIITQHGDARVMNFSGVQGLTISGNQIEYLGPNPRATIGFEYATIVLTPQVMRDVVITDNTSKGGSSYFLSAQSPVEVITLGRNTSRTGLGAWFQGGVVACQQDRSQLLGAGGNLTIGPVPGQPSGCVTQ